MHLTRFDQAPAYEAPNHFDMRCLLLEGRLTVVSELDGRQEEQELGPYDSCRFAPGEKRQLLNRSPRPVLVALVMANAAPG